MTPIVFPKVPEKGASDEEWTKYDKNLQDVISKYINDAIKKASDATTAVSDSIPGIASSAQAIAGIDNGTIISPLRMREGLNATGDAPIYACRAWVNFTGTGTVTKNGSGNVESITDNGTGKYTINFTTAMPDANYSVVASARKNDANDDGNMVAAIGNISTGRTLTTTTCPITTCSPSVPVLTDSPEIFVAVFR
jgi:hypothetical protein